MVLGGVVMKEGIYRVVCTANNKCYVGQSKNINNRISRHKTELKANRHTNKGMQSDYNNFGIDSFYYEVLELCLAEERNEKEAYWTGFYKSNIKSNGYNLTSGGKGGFKHNESTKQKMSKASKGKPKSLEARRKMSEARKGKPAHNKGKKHTEEAKRKMSEAKRDYVPWIKGRNHTEESKKKMSESKKGLLVGRKANEETKKKISESLKGNQNCKGRKLSEEHKSKLADCNRNRVWTEESKRKMIETRKRNKELKERAK